MFTDKEHRILLAAMRRERNICEEVDRKTIREPYEDSLLDICNSIDKKIYDIQHKYRWHDLRKNPDDLPVEHYNCDPIEYSSFSDNVLVMTDKWHCPIVAYINLSVKLWHNPLTEQTFYDESLGEVIAWRYIESSEEDT